MAKSNERLSLKVTTPRGVAIYPKLNEPDTKFDPDGVYETKLRIDPATAQGMLGKEGVTWDEFLAAVDSQQETFLDEKKAELAASKDPKTRKKATTIKNIEWGREADLDEDGEETENIVIKAKMKASGKSKKDGKPWTRKPDIFDARGKKLDNPPAIWGGSVLKVAGEIVPYYSAKDNVVGSTLYLGGVQVIELVSGQGRTASAYGFGEEDGFTAAEAEFGDESGGDEGDGNF